MGVEAQSGPWTRYGCVSPCCWWCWDTCPPPLDLAARLLASVGRVACGNAGTTLPAPAITPTHTLTHLTLTRQPVSASANDVPQAWPCGPTPNSGQMPRFGRMGLLGASHEQDAALDSGDDGFCYFCF